MALRIFIACLFVAGVLVWPQRPALGDVYKNEGEEARAYNVTRTIKTVEGLNFLVEKDRPIEKVGSIYRPIDMDSYVALKFAKLQKIMEGKFSVLEDRLIELEDEVASLKKIVSGNPAEGRSKNSTAPSPAARPTS